MKSRTLNILNRHLQDLYTKYLDMYVQPEGPLLANWTEKDPWIEFNQFVDLFERQPFTYLPEKDIFDLVRKASRTRCYIKALEAGAMTENEIIIEVLSL